MQGAVSRKYKGSLLYLSNKRRQPVVFYVFPLSFKLNVISTLQKDPFPLNHKQATK
jgi:hypothetical protein